MNRQALLCRNILEYPQITQRELARVMAVYGYDLQRGGS